MDKIEKAIIIYVSDKNHNEKKILMNYEGSQTDMGKMAKDCFDKYKLNYNDPNEEGLYLIGYIYLGHLDIR